MGEPSELRSGGTCRAARFGRIMRCTPHNKRGIFGVIAQWVTRVSLSDWLALQARIRGESPPAIERPSFGWGCIAAQFMRGLGALRAGYGERLGRHMGEPSKLRSGEHAGLRRAVLFRDHSTDGAALHRNLCGVSPTLEAVLRLTDKRNQIAQRPAAPIQAADNQSDAITQKTATH